MLFCIWSSLKNNIVWKSKICRIFQEKGNIAVNTTRHNHDILKRRFYQLCVYCTQDVIFILPESIVIAVYWIVNSFILVWIFISFPFCFLALCVCHVFDKMSYRVVQKTSHRQLQVIVVTNISQGNVVTHLMCGMIFTDDFVREFWPSLCERILKIV